MAADVRTMSMGYSSLRFAHSRIFHTRIRFDAVALSLLEKWRSEIRIRVQRGFRVPGV